MSKNIARRHLNPGQRNAIALEYETFYEDAIKKAEAERKATQPRGQAGSKEGGRFVTQRDESTVADLPQSVSSSNRKAREKAAKVTGGSGRGVQQAKAVKRDAPDLYTGIAILANLPPFNGPGQFDRLASPSGLAAAYYGVQRAADGQCTAVRRALRGLEQQGLATRWTTRITRQGDPSGWSQPER